MMDSPLLASIEANLLEAYEHLGRSLGATFHREKEITYFFTGTALPLCNGVVRFHASPDDADHRIEAIGNEAVNRKLPITWLLGPSSGPADLEHRLQAQGWRLDEQVPGMAIELERAASLDVAVPPGFSIQEVTDGQMMQAWLRVLCAGFGFPDPIKQIFFGLYEKFGFVSAGSVLYLLGLLDGEPVGTTLLTFGGGLAGIYGVATLPQVRRQGIGAAMTVAAMRAARQRHYQTGTLQATPMGLSVYRRLGWQEHCLFKTYTLFPQSLP